MTTFYNISFDIADGVGSITINRPQAANAMDLETMQEFHQAVTQCEDNPKVRAVLISGTGKVFCAGGDLKAFSAQDHLPRYIKAVTFYLHGAISRLTRMSAPVIAAVNGNAGGGGLSLLVAADIVYCAQNARFTMGYTRIGLSPDGSTTFFLPRIIGLRRTMELALTNRTFSAQEAYDWGLVTRVLPDETVVAEARALAVELAAGPTLAYGVTKRLLYASFSQSLETQMEDETQGIAAMSGTADGAEGIRAFLEKRPPQFKGS